MIEQARGTLISYRRGGPTGLLVGLLVGGELIGGFGPIGRVAGLLVGLLVGGELIGGFGPVGLVAGLLVGLLVGGELIGGLGPIGLVVGLVVGLLVGGELIGGFGPIGLVAGLLVDLLVGGETIGGGPNGLMFAPPVRVTLDVLANTGFKPMASAIRPMPRNVQLLLPKAFIETPIHKQNL